MFFIEMQISLVTDMLKGSYLIVRCTYLVYLYIYNYFFYIVSRTDYTNINFTIKLYLVPLLNIF